MRAKLREARKTRSSLSKREKMRRKSLSISLRLRYRALSYCQDRRRLLLGGPTGMKPKSRASWRVWLSS